LSPELAVAAGVKVYVYRVPLAITNQPHTQWVSPGVDVTFSVGVSGNRPFAYQWRKDGSLIPGATQSTFALVNVARSNSAVYAVVVTNASGGSLLSSNATLRVFTPQLLSGPSIGAGEVSISFGDSPGGAMVTNYIPFFQVQASSNLIDWEVLNTTLSVTNDRLVFRDTNLMPQRFYRVIEQ
jgi:hypothetical protein